MSRPSRPYGEQFPPASVWPQPQGLKLAAETRGAVALPSLEAIVAASRMRSPAEQWLRGLRLALHLARAIATLMLVYPGASRTKKLLLLQVWSRQLLSIIGLRPAVNGSVVPGALLVANQVSWVDIFTITAASPTAFVARQEVRGWPLIGWLCERTDTLFIERSRRIQAQAVRRTVAGRLVAGYSVTVFPAGTTNDGTKVLRFHNALLHAAISAAAQVQPLAIRYRDASGCTSAVPRHAGETTILQCLRALLAQRGLVAELTCLPPIDATGRDRRALARECATAIREALTDSAGNGQEHFRIQPRPARPLPYVSPPIGPRPGR